MKNLNLRSALKATTTLQCAVVSTLTVSAMLMALPGIAAAQDATTAAPAKADQPTEVVVTGSILRKKLKDTADPVTTVTAVDLQNRGITQITTAIQDISAGGSSSLPNSFTANGAFATGAANVSLRGLTSNSTLVVVDGLRTAYYPLADDGVRNFVDLNSIPDIITDHVDVLKDGASSTYGADAIAGVVNVITKKTFVGNELRVSGGNTTKGGGGTFNVQGLFGGGNLHSDGYNAYVGFEYQHDDALYSRQRGSLYNTADQSGTCGTAAAGSADQFGDAFTGAICRVNGIVNGLQAPVTLGGTTYSNQILGIGATSVASFMPIDANGNPIGTATWQLAPGATCGNLKSVTLTPGVNDALANKLAGVPSGAVEGLAQTTTLCQEDLRKEYGTISPDEKHYSMSGRFTKEFSDTMEGYVSATFAKSDALSRNAPSNFSQTSTPGSAGTIYSSQNGGLALPVYICPTGVGCNATNGTLNPNNPFAAQGELAQLNYLFSDIPNTTEAISNTYRFNAGLKGEFDAWGAWNYDIEGTVTEDDLSVIAKGDLYIANLITAVNTGSYNFINPSANSAAENAFVAPTNIQNSTSKLDMLQATITRPLMDLIGGPLQLGLGASTRFESIDNPSANNDLDGATNRWFTLNPVGVIGARRTNAAFIEFDAPILKQLDIDVSARYDDYSTGNSSVSPKIGARWSPTKWLTLRMTDSDGFRVPTFSEANALPTTGFINVTAPASFLALHNNDGYGENYSLGETTIGTQGLKPEKSTNFTAGFVLDPTPNLSFSVDYYSILKKNVIVPNNANIGNAIAAYYAGTPEPAGYTVTANPADPNDLSAKPELGFIQYGYINQDAELTDGFDIGANARYNLPWGIKYRGMFDGNLTDRLNLETPDGTQKYVGTIGPYNNVSASGTPKYRFTFANTFIYQKVSATLTANYTSGYSLQGEDFGDTPGLCTNSDGTTASAINSVYIDGQTPVACKVKGFLDFDLHASYDLPKEGWQVFANVLNLFDAKAPFDPTTYGGFNYNPAWSNAGIYGPMVTVGIQAKF